jgi:hypothetical protein
MIVYLHGSDTYRRLRKLQDIVADFRRRNPNGAVRMFENATESLEEFYAFFSSRSLFPVSALGVFTHAFRTGGLHALPAARRKELAVRIRALHDDALSFLIFVEDKAPPKEFSFIGKEPARVQAFDPLSPSAAASFLARELERYGTTVPAARVSQVVREYREDTWGALNALIPLGFLSSASATQRLDETISRAAVNPFPFLRALQDHSLSQRLYALEYLLSCGEDAAKLFALMSYQQGVTIRFADYDASLKAGGLDYDEALLDAVIS